MSSLAEITNLTVTTDFHCCWIDRSNISRLAHFSCIQPLKLINAVPELVLILSNSFKIFINTSNPETFDLFSIEIEAIHFFLISSAPIDFR
jgi:hypothetical protein